MGSAYGTPESGVSCRSGVRRCSSINGDVGAVLASSGRPWLALTFTIENNKIAEYEVIADLAGVQPR